MFYLGHRLGTEDAGSSVAAVKPKEQEKVEAISCR